MTDMLKNILEAVLLSADMPLTVGKLQGLFDQGESPDREQMKAALDELIEDYEHRGIELRKIGSGYRFQTRERYAAWINKLHAVRPPRISRALLETLAIIAYRQPATRGDIEEVRGVSVSSEIMQKLQEREWVKQVGVREAPGRPALFGTTAEFLSYFNLESLKDLPELMEAHDINKSAAELNESPQIDQLSAPEAVAGQQGQSEQLNSGENSNADEYTSYGEITNLEEDPDIGETPNRDGAPNADEEMKIKEESDQDAADESSDDFDDSEIQQQAGW